MQAAIQSRIQGSGEMHREFQRPKVLLVEDSEDNRAMMKYLLEMSGYEVIEAVNGEQAVNTAQARMPDLILMDLSMPRMDGLAATRGIRSVSALKDVPIVVVSAHDRTAFYAEAIASGCNEYVTKPIDFGRLELLLKRLAPPS